MNNEPNNNMETLDSLDLNGGQPPINNAPDTMEPNAFANTQPAADPMTSAPNMMGPTNPTAADPMMSAPNMMGPVTPPAPDPMMSAPNMMGNGQNNMMQNNMNMAATNPAPHSQYEEQPVEEPNNKATSNIVEKLKENKKILTIVGGVIVVVVLLLVFGKMLGGKTNGGSTITNRGTKNGTTLNMGEELKVVTNYTDAVIKVEDVERNFQITSFGTTDSFTKIKLTVHNKSSKNFDSLLTNIITIADANGNNISESACYDSTLGPALYYGYMEDAIDLTVKPNETNSGYLYCKDDSNSAVKLKVVSISSYDKNEAKQGKIVSTGSNTYYFNLK